MKKKWENMEKEEVIAEIDAQMEAQQKEKKF